MVQMKRAQFGSSLYPRYLYTGCVWLVEKGSSLFCLVTVPPDMPDIFT